MNSIAIVGYHEIEPAFYEQHVETLFYAYPWLRVLQQTYGYDFFTALDQDTEQFWIFTEVDSLFGKKVMSLPFSDYTDIGEDRQGSSEALLQALQARYPDSPITLKTRRPASSDATRQLGAVVRRAYFHRINTEDISLARQNQSSSFQRGVKKAQRSNVKVELRRDELALRNFYSLYHQLRTHKFHSIPQPYAFFQNIFDLFVARDQGFILQAEHQEKVIASIIVLQHKEVLYYKFGCSSADALPYRPNNLIFEELIQYAHRQRFRAIDLGLSGVSKSYEGLVRFKESMGGSRHDITYFQRSPDSYDAAKEQSFKKLLSSLTQVIVSEELDVNTTDQFSNILYPYFA